MTVVLFAQMGMELIRMESACSTHWCLSTDDHKFMSHEVSLYTSTMADYKLAQENGDTILTAWQGCCSNSLTGDISVIKFQKIRYKDDWLLITVCTIAQTLNQVSNVMLAEIQIHKKFSKISPHFVLSSLFMGSLISSIAPQQSV